IHKKFSRLRKNASTIFEDIDTSKFRKNVDLNMAVEVITATLELLINKYIDSFKKCKADEALDLYNKLQIEIKKYFDILKNGIYK
ncbi:MAG: TetR/AcrR family transcriptional regulator, partial [Actinobacteria bacterium]|nr:TetR/AcrR family transcriptional regulator [Actinomycetota bacterium]